MIIVLFASTATATANGESRVLLWGGDAEGGAPFVEADPNDPTQVRGFDVEVAEEIARGLGRQPHFAQVAYASIDQSVKRGDFDIGMSGLEDTPARRAELATSIPYYEFTYTLTVRQSDRGRIGGLADLRGKRVGAMSGTVGYQHLVDNEKRYGFTVLLYDDDVHPYEDLRRERIDAVVLDNILAARAMQRVPGLYTNFANPVATGHYVIVAAPANIALRDRVDAILVARMRDGTLERIYRKWGIWNDLQRPFFDSVIGQQAVRREHASSRAPDGLRTQQSIVTTVSRYLPALLRAGLVSILVSVSSMFIAIIVGAVIAVGRVYGAVPVQVALTAYVEIVRGTPLLLQLFVVYYGLSGIIRLPALFAALIALGFNYAAYESEIYRGAMQAVPPGQLEAARTLGFTEAQIFRLVRAPQAFRIALPPMTNDFVALLKDSSLVSAITVVELTKQTQIFATNLGNWVLPGATCALLYLLMSLPIARLAGWMEGRWRIASR
jgi:polar amino acid transport system substrate-binding protein